MQLPRFAPLLVFLFFICFHASATAADKKARQRTDVPMPRVIEYRWMNLKQWKEFHEKDLKRAKEGPVDILFLGDSITECWESRGSKIWKKEYAPYRAANFGIGGDTTQNVLWRITKGGALERIYPRVVVLMIGTNNIGLHNDTPDDVAKGVHAIIGVLRNRYPQTQILLVSIFPRGKTPDDSMRKKVVATNAILERFGTIDHVTYLPIWDQFLKRNGTLPDNIMPDYLHPNEKGYQIWADAMRPVLHKLLYSGG